MRNIFSIVKIGLGATDNVASLDSSILNIEKEIKKMEESSNIRDRIVIGEFSQSGAISLISACQNTSATFVGHVSLSEWLSKSENTKVSELKKTPLLWGNGKYDEIFLFYLHKIGVNTLIDQRINAEACSNTMQYSMCPEQ